MYKYTHTQNKLLKDHKLKLVDVLTIFFLVNILSHKLQTSVDTEKKLLKSSDIYLLVKSKP